VVTSQRIQNGSEAGGLPASPAARNNFAVGSLQRLSSLVCLGLGLAFGAGAVAWLLERKLRDRDGGVAPPPIRTVVEIDAPIERVWDRLADIERQPEWMHDLTSVVIRTPGPIGVGTRVDGRVRALGIELDDPIEVAAFEPPSHFAVSHVGLVTGTGDIRLAVSADGTSTTVTWNETLISPVLPHLGALVLQVVFGPIFRRDLERLAEVVEGEVDA
jgi:uncharacterized protein YndB with AHSA1/START domain